MIFTKSGKIRAAEVRAALLRQEEEFRLLVDNIPAIVFKGYVDGTIDFFDAKVEQMIGYSKADFDSRRLKWTDLIIAEDKDTAGRQFVHALKTGSSYVREYRIRSKSGGLIWIQERSHIVACERRKVDFVSGVFFDITEHKRAEGKLKSDHDFIAALLDTVDALVVVLDSEGKIVRFNSACEQKTGYSFEEVKGRPVRELSFCPEEIEGAHHGDTVQQVQCGPFPSRYENHWVTKDGSMRLIAWSNTTLPGDDGQVRYIIATGIDITERKHAEESLRQSERYFRSLLFHMHEDILVIDRERMITDVNKDYLVTLARRRQEVIGRRCYEVTHGFSEPCDLYGEECLLRKVFETGEPRTSRHEHVNAAGARVLVDILHSPLRDEAGNITHVIEAVRDVTHEAELERRLRQAHKMEAIGTLAGGIAHDFNNILSAIIGFSELALLSTTEDMVTYEYMEQVLNAGNRAKELVKQILAFGRQSEQERQPVQICMIVKEALKLLRGTLPSTIDIRENISGEGIVLSDPSEIHQVLMNLCTNAYHALRSKGGILEVTLSDIILDASSALGQRRIDLPPGPYLRLTVSDTGCGMDTKTSERIFEPYFTTKSAGEGTGLGLAVVHGIVKSYNGAITVYSEPGQGTTFHVYLPVMDHPGEMAEAGPCEAVPQGEEHILFVDDEEALTGLAGELLEYLGYRVTTHQSSVKALEAFRTNPDQFDLVITDLTMPHMTGIELTEEILRIRPDLPVILCTGFSELVTAEKARAAGVREFLMKPIVVREIAGKIRAALDEVREDPGCDSEDSTLP